MIVSAGVVRVSQVVCSGRCGYTDLAARMNLGNTRKYE